MKRVRILLEVCGVVLFAVVLATSAGRSATSAGSSGATSETTDSRAIGVSPSYKQMNDPNFKLIAALEARVNALQKQLANLQSDFGAHKHRYNAPVNCQYTNLATFKKELAGASTNYGVCVVDPNRFDRSGTGTFTGLPNK